MKAIVVREFGPPDVMRLEEVPDPSPGPGQVLIRVKATGVNPVDTYIRAGTYARMPPLPYTPGMDCAGIVEAVGTGVTSVAAGESVYAHGVAGGHGATAELTVCNADQLHPLARQLTFAQGAAIGVPYGTAWRALFMRAQARAGETVLVHGGSGGVGTAAIQLAKAHGLRVIATAGTPNGLALVGKEGAHHTLDHRDADYMASVRPLTGGRGADVILEMLANVNLDRDLDVLAPRGRVVVIGSRGRVEIDPRRLMRTDGAILGMLQFNSTAQELAEIHAGLTAGFENGSLRPVVGKTFSLDQAPEAHAAVMQPGAFGKIVINL